MKGIIRALVDFLSRIFGKPPADAAKAEPVVTPPFPSTDRMQAISRDGLRHLVRSEGSRSKMYRDIAGYKTIGVGHLLTQSELSSGKIIINGQSVKWSAGLTEAQILDLLDQDVGRFEDAVRKNVTVPLKQHQFDTLVSFSFNVGTGAFRKSTLLKVLNAKKYDQVPSQLMRWNRAGGRVVRGLTKRREREVELWNGKYH